MVSLGFLSGTMDPLPPPPQHTCGVGFVSVGSVNDGSVTTDLKAFILQGTVDLVLIELTLCELLQGGHTLLVIHGVHL
jgi:hypothetical protein